MTWCLASRDNLSLAKIYNLLFNVFLSIAAMYVNWCTGFKFENPDPILRRMKRFLDASFEAFTVVMFQVEDFCVMVGYHRFRGPSKHYTASQPRKARLESGFLHEIIIFCMKKT